MRFYSSRLGEMDLDESLIIEFPEGIPGFRDFKKFVIIKKSNNQIFFLLHSVEDKDLAFIITNPYYFKPDYSFNICDEDCKLLNIKEDGPVTDELGIFVITKITKNKDVFINLKAPICINFNSKIGKQIILYNYDYPHSLKLDRTCQPCTESERSTNKLCESCSVTR